MTWVLLLNSLIGFYHRKAAWLHFFLKTYSGNVWAKSPFTVFCPGASSPARGKAGESMSLRIGCSSYETSSPNKPGVVDWSSWLLPLRDSTPWQRVCGRKLDRMMYNFQPCSPKHPYKFYCAPCCSRHAARRQSRPQHPGQPPPRNQPWSLRWKLPLCLRPQRPYSQQQDRPLPPGHRPSTPGHSRTSASWTAL